MNDHCQICNHPLSQCGPPSVDGEPTIDCLVCCLREKVSELEVSLKAAKREALGWKANHDNQVRLKRALADRPDLKERASAWEALVIENEKLKLQVAKLKKENDSLEGMAGCMDLFMDDMRRLGIFESSVPPMCATEGVLAALNKNRFPVGSTLEEYLGKLEYEFISATLKHFNGSKEKAAAALGVSIATLYRRFRETRPKNNEYTESIQKEEKAENENHQSCNPEGQAS